MEATTLDYVLVYGFMGTISLMISLLVFCTLRDIYKRKD